MSRTLWIAAIAAVACGCGRSTNPPTTTEVAQARSASNITGSATAAQQAETRAADRSVPVASALPPDQLVRVTGCLMGGEGPAAPGNSAAPGTSPAVGGTGTGPGPNLFVLMRANPTPTAPASAQTAQAGLGARCSVALRSIGWTAIQPSCEVT